MSSVFRSFPSFSFPVFFRGFKAGKCRPRAEQHSGEFREIPVRVSHAGCSQLVYNKRDESAGPRITRAHGIFRRIRVYETRGEDRTADAKCERNSAKASSQLSAMLVHLILHISCFSLPLLSPYFNIFIILFAYQWRHAHLFHIMQVSSVLLLISILSDPRRVTIAIRASWLLNYCKVPITTTINWWDLLISRQLKLYSNVYNSTPVEVTGILFSF